MCWSQPLLPHECHHCLREVWFWNRQWWECSLCVIHPYYKSVDQLWVYQHTARCFLHMYVSHIHEYISSMCIHVCAQEILLMWVSMVPSSEVILMDYLPSALETVASTAGRLPFCNGPFLSTVLHFTHSAWEELSLYVFCFFCVFVWVTERQKEREREIYPVATDSEGRSCFCVSRRWRELLGRPLLLS